jgi:hypothetical protein
MVCTATGMQALFPGHVVGRDLVGAARIGDGVLGEAAGRRAHHPVARLEVLDLAAHRLDLAGAFQADDGARPAGRAVAIAGRDREVGAVERRRAHLDQDLVGLGLGLGDIADLDAFFGDNGCFHDFLLRRSCCRGPASSGRAAGACKVFPWDGAAARPRSRCCAGT